MPRLVGFALIVCVAGLVLAGPAAASKRIYSYDSANPLTEQMTEAGLTFVFDRSFMSTRVLQILETHDIDVYKRQHRHLGRRCACRSSARRGGEPSLRTP